MFNSVDTMIQVALREEKPLWRVILEDDLKDRGKTEKSSRAKMLTLW